MLALSTSWNALKLDSGTRIASEIADLGFKAIELNFSLDSKMVQEIRQYCLENGITITSVHNYCPTPEEFPRQEAMPDCFSLSSLDEEERKKAVFFTSRTIKTAKKLGCRAVVLHSGRVEIDDHTRELIDLYNKGQSESNTFKSIFESFVTDRRKKASEYVDKVIKSYKELLPVAEDNAIMLGVENRFYYREIPFLLEFEAILDTFKSGLIGYWHDVGHAFILEKLGFMPEGSLLQKFGKRLIGIHIHNIKDMVDHQAPVDGEFDLKKILPYIKKDTIKIIEMSRHIPGELIKKSHGYLKELLND